MVKENFTQEQIQQLKDRHYAEFERARKWKTIKNCLKLGAMIGTSVAAFTVCKGFGDFINTSIFGNKDAN